MVVLAVQDEEDFTAGHNGGLEHQLISSNIEIS